MSTADDKSFRLCGGAYRYGRWFAVLMLPLLVLVVFVAGIAAGLFAVRPSQQHPMAASSPAELADQFQIFWEAWDSIERRFYSPVPLDHQDMTYGAIRGMLASLGDQHTILVEPPQHRLETDTLQGGFGGIGVVVAINDQQPTVVEVQPGSPAEKAGLEAQDVLLLVDGTSVSSLTIDRIVLLLRGPVGSRVELVVRRASEGELSFSAVREQIEVPSLTWQVLAEDIGYVHVQFFSGRTGEELSHTVAGLSKAGAHALVLDLRGNGGGVLDGAMDVLGQLIGHGIGFRELGRHGEERRHPIPFRLRTVDWPLLVLVDGGTASSAEIVAAAIRDYGRGLLVGEPTFGKGSVQAIFPLGDGSALHVTVSRWLTSSGRPIDGVGLQPDIVVAPGTAEEEGDLSLQRAIEHLGLLLAGATTMTARDIM